MSNFPLGAPSVQFSSIVSNPAAVQNSDGSVAVVNLGHNGDLFVSEIHGKRYTAAARSNLFIASANGATGVSPLAPAGTTSGFMFYNPLGTNVLMEIHKIRAVPLTATDVVGGLALEYGVPPTAVGTAATIVSMPLQGSRGGPLCKASFGSTIAAMAWLQALTFVQTTGGLMASDGSFDFDGSLVLFPGSAVNIVSTTTQGTNKWLQDVTWSEWLM